MEIKGNENGGIIYLIKNGKIRAFTIEREENNLYINSNEKKKMKQLFNDSARKDATAVDKDKVFLDLLDNGYTIIRCFNPQKIAQLLIGANITKEDYFAIMKIVTMLVQEYITEDNQIDIDIEIYNRRVTRNGQHETELIEFLSSCWGDLPHKDTEGLYSVIDTFLSEKLNVCSEKQEEELDHFRNFDIHSLLTNDDKHCINSDNAGVILITPNEIIQDNCRRQYHWYQIEQMLGNGFHKPIDFIGDFSYRILAKDLNIIILRMWKEKDKPTEVGKGNICVDMPDTISEFQYNSMLDILQSLRENSNIIIHMNAVELVDQEVPRESTPDEILELLRESHDLIINPLLKPLERSFPPRPRVITEEEVDETLADVLISSEEIEEALSTGFGEDIKKSLEKMALEGLTLRGEVDLLLKTILSLYNIQR